MLQPSQAIAETINQGPWLVSADPGTSVTYTSPRYVSTTGKVYACVSTSVLQGANPSWHFALVWYDGGKDKVLWKSIDFTATGRHCSPVRHTTHNARPRYFVRIKFANGAGASSGTAGGLWDLYLSF
jgi:hypothetical protein